MAQLLLIFVGFWAAAGSFGHPVKVGNLSAATLRGDEIQYLTVQVLTYSPGLDKNNKIRVNATPAPFVKSNIKRLVQDNIIQRYGGKTGDGKSRKLGFAVGPMTLSHTDRELRQIIKQSFEIAEETGLVIAFHIDDSMFWEKRWDLWKDPKNIEWLNWEGTPNTGRALKWGRRPAKLAPQMCFNSSVITKEIRKIAKDVIGDEIKKGIDKLTAIGKRELFAGVFAGWETHIGQDFETETRLGYCAMTNRGFSKRNTPKDLNLERVRVVQEFVELWTKSLFDAGIPKEKIYSHLPYFPAAIKDKTPIPYLEFINFAPAYAALGQYHRPGYSLYNMAGKEDLKELYALFAEKSVSHWAMAEGTAAGNEATLGGTQTAYHWESYLAVRFNHGASIVNVFPVGLDKAEAIQAFKKFLRGEKLIEAVVEAKKDPNGESQIDPGCFMPCLESGKTPENCMKRCTK
jgi:hypothetical protein